MSDDKQIAFIEPLFFIFFGLLHLHRIWAFFDRKGYSSYWLSQMDNRNWFYFVMMGIMSVLCIAGIVLFVKHRGNNQWWRWVYIFGGGYVLFDLFSILIKLGFWKRLLYWMFDVTNQIWNVIWGTFCILGLASFIVGLALIKLIMQEKLRSRNTNE